MGVEKSAPFLLFIIFFCIIKKINTEIKMSLKGTIRFVLEPDYNQEESNPKDVVPSSDYSFHFDHTEGMQITVDEIQFHFNAWLRSIGYVVGYEDE